MSTPSAMFSSLRPRQWTKNLIVFAPLVFTARVADSGSVARSMAAFACFCLLSSAAYLVNDVRDADADRVHDRKRERPVASGALAPRAALWLAVVLALAGLAGSFALSVPTGTAAIAFAALQAAYTFALRSVPLIDVLAISAAFVLRAVAGALAIGVSSSPWLLACAAMLAAFLALGKRRHELVSLGDGAARHRHALARYSPAVVDRVLSGVAAATFVTYALYGVLSSTARAHPNLVFTVPFVGFGLGRYLHLVHRRDLGGSPEEILLTDATLIIDILLFLAVAIAAVGAG